MDRENRSVSGREQFSERMQDLEMKKYLDRKEQEDEMFRLQTKSC